MLRGRLRNSGWQGVCLVAITYVYFLIFAQFAFIHRLATLGIVGANLNAVMAAMSAAGILFSLLAPRVQRWKSSRLRLRVGLAASGAAALLSLLPLNIPAAIAVALLTGAGLALLTVTLATHLRQLTGNHHSLLKTGLGTGIGYLICNIPSLFAGTPEFQALTAAALCLGGILLAPPDTTPQFSDSPGDLPDPLPFPLVVACFAALVWLDSAAFFIIQSTAALKAGTWQGSAHLWANAFLHFSAALVSAWLLARRGLSFILSAAFLALAAACLLLLDPARALPASVFYPVGVSLYSVALVAYPSLLAPANSLAERARRAGWIYAIAGWIASALGIGMGQNLGHVPPAFVAVAGAVILSPVLFKIIPHRIREIALTVAILFIALLIYRFQPTTPVAASLSPVERGRKVYISEGCINCHSQYVRPNTADVLMWGPVESLDQLHRQRPPLIGNRRQGPDLSEVGVRRSPLWLKAHLFNPAQVSGASIMPSYAFLFRDQRGNDLVAYLSSLRTPDAAQNIAQHSAQEQQWHLSASAISGAKASDGLALYNRYCATCHNPDGPTRIAWQAEFTEQPAILTAGAFKSSQTAKPPIDHLAHVIKFGIPQSDMAGHEYMSDKDIASLALWLSQNPAPSPVPNAMNSKSGDKQ